MLSNTITVTSADRGSMVLVVIANQIAYCESIYGEAVANAGIHLINGKVLWVREPIDKIKALLNPPEPATHVDPNDGDNWSMMGRGN